MTAELVDLTPIPEKYRRIARSWYEWQGAYLTTVGGRPGDPKPGYFNPLTDLDRHWGGYAPTVTAEGDLRIASLDLFFYLHHDDDSWEVQRQERNTRDPACQLFGLADAEKYMLYSLGEATRPFFRVDDLGSRWYRAERNPLVEIRPAEQMYQSRVKVRGEQRDRYETSDFEAVRFSHAVTMSYGELDAALREGLEQAFRLSITFTP